MQCPYMHMTVMVVWSCQKELEWDCLCTAKMAGSAVVVWEGPTVARPDTWHNLMLELFGYDQHVSHICTDLLHPMALPFLVGSFRLIIPAPFFSKYFPLMKLLMPILHARCQREVIGVCREVTATYRKEYLCLSWAFYS
jgi:hypothetical protein